ncbi:hypothetical protein IW140_004716 [Coemansia sp. RSA 1813]|nr:hypothetical protein EV178_005400 [Coemansia sp. RSA 1646]KAJ2566925.1 hypothetical protein IW140_004716 [Coemansia sp. RSA 1813]
MNTLVAQQSDYRQATTGQETRSRTHSYTARQSSGTTVPEHPGAGDGAFTFRFTDKANAAKSNTRGTEVRTSPPKNMGLVGSPVREAKQRAATTTSGLGVARDEAAPGYMARTRRPSAGPGYMMPGPLVTIDECTERIDRLLQRVQQTNMEHALFKALASPTTPMTPTRLDPTPPPTPPAQIAGSSSTVSTVSLGANSSHSALGLPTIARGGSGMAAVGDNNNEGSAEADGLYSPRRRAVTMDHHLGSTRRNQNTPSGRSPSSMRARAEELRARRLAREEREDRAAAEGRSVTSPMLSPLAGGGTFKPRANTDFVSPGHMRRNISNDSSAGYSGSETATVCPSGGEEDPDFFNNKDVVSMFRELPLPFKELDWEKQVYYYHVAQTNDAYRKATEDVEIRDCRAECLGDLLGEKMAARVVARSSSNKREELPVLRRQRGSEDDVVGNGVADDFSDLALRSVGTEDDDVASWLDRDSDGDCDDEGERSFDWSRDGFGYMEFRRNSRISQGQASVLSPVGGGGLGTGLNGGSALGKDAYGVSPLSRPFSKQHKQSPLHKPIPATAFKAYSPRQSNPQTSDVQSASLLGATTSNSAEPLSPVTARVAADKFSEAITPKALRRSSSSGSSGSSNNNNNNKHSGSRSRSNSGDVSGGGGGSSGKELFARMRGSMDRVMPQRWRGSSITTGRPDQRRGRMLQQGSSQALSLIRESDVATESDDGWQVLSHADGDAGTPPAAEQQLKHLTSDNKRLEREISQAREAIAALTRVLVKMR